MSKITVSGSKRITLMNKPYEPIVVETSLTIEKDLEEDVKIVDVQERINKILDEDLERKAAETLRKQNSIRKRISHILTED